VKRITFFSANEDELVEEHDMPEELRDEEDPEEAEVSAVKIEDVAWEDAGSPVKGYTKDPDSEDEPLQDDSYTASTVPASLFQTLEGVTASILAALNREFDSVLIEARKLATRKGADYEISGPITSRMPFGNRSFAHEVHKKADRAVSIVASGRAHNESLDDTIMDLIVYAAFWQAARRLRF
jgi:hypothetical protein